MFKSKATVYLSIATPAALSILSLIIVAIISSFLVLVSQQPDPPFKITATYEDGTEVPVKMVNVSDYPADHPARVHLDELFNMFKTNGVLDRMIEEATNGQSQLPHL